MRQFLVLLAVASLLVLAASQISPSPYVNVLTVSDADKVCSSVDGCTTVATTCCGDSGCQFYSAVSTAQASKYLITLREAAQTTCANVACPVNVMACAGPSATCSFTAGSNTGVCTITDTSVIVPTKPEPIVPSPAFQQAVCGFSCNANGALVCGATQSPSTGVPTCRTDAVTSCKNTCYSTHSTCSLGLKRQVAPNTCSVIATSPELDSCLSKCVATVTPPVDVVPSPKPQSTCGFTCNSNGLLVCGATDSSSAIATSCRAADTVTACKNSCYANIASCSAVAKRQLVSNTCAIVSSALGLDTCLARCSAVTEPTSTATLTPTSTSSSTCAVLKTDTCRSYCGKSSSTTLPPSLNCQPTNTVDACLNTCDAQFAICSASDNTVGCAFTSRDPTGYKACQDRCSANTVVPTPVNALSCSLSTSQNCELLCTASSISNGFSNCIADPVVQCINGCKRELTTCQVAISPNTLTGSTCAFVPANRTAYSVCFDKCRLITAPTPTVTDLKCVAAKGERCNDICIAGTTAPASSCTPDAPTTCANRCQSIYGQCAATSNGCSYVLSDSLGYRSCLAACTPTTATPTPAQVTPRQCTRTGCYGEVCSPVQLLSQCSSTDVQSLQKRCEGNCYAAANCAANADGSCGWTITVALKECLASCAPTVTSLPAPTTVIPPVDVCKVTGCQRELCIASTQREPVCDAALVEPSCETKCLQYTQCGVVRSSTVNTLQCGWTPVASAPAAYGECLLKCRQPANPCFVSGCGKACSTIPDLSGCTNDLAFDCPTRCRAAFSICNMTQTGCGFVALDGLQRCIDFCNPTAAPTPSKQISPCPSGVPEVQCLADPCANQQCSAFPGATCTASTCGDCRAVWTLQGREVQCDADCFSLPCDKCIAKSSCQYCSGSYSTGAATESFGVCMGANDASRCLASNSASLISDSRSCPVTSAPVDGISTSVSDSSSLQNEIASGASLPVREKFIIVITLVVNETNTNANGFNLVKMFVDLIGAGVPDATDRSQVCLILKDALVKVDGRVGSVASQLTCDLNEKVSKKRDTSYVAQLSFPAGSTSSAASLVASFGLLLAAVALAF